MLRLVLMTMCSSIILVNTCLVENCKICSNITTVCQQCMQGYSLSPENSCMLAVEADSRGSGHKYIWLIVVFVVAVLLVIMAISLLKYYTRSRKKKVELKDIRIESIMMSPVIISNIKTKDLDIVVKQPTEAIKKEQGQIKEYSWHSTKSVVKTKRIVPLSRLEKKILPKDNSLGQTRQKMLSTFSVEPSTVEIILPPTTHKASQQVQDQEGLE